MGTKIYIAIARYIVLILFVFAFAQTRLEAQSNEVPERTLEGVWYVQTTPRNCATGDPNPVAAFVGLYTFHRDGTMISWY